MSFEPSAEVRRIRDAIDHPIIDSDGHIIEFLPEVHDIMAAVGGPGLVDKFKVVEHGARKPIDLTVEQRRAAGLMRSAWWGLPARNTLDRATALLPKLLYERLDEIGIDLAVLYNAVIDALSHLGVTHIDMPCTPERVWQAIRFSSEDSTTR